LEAAMLSYFQLTTVPTIVVDPASLPGISVTSALLASIYREGELFMRNTLWDAPLSELLTTRRAYVSERTAMPIYGVPPPSDVDADGFGPVALPEIRSGLLTSSPFLGSRARPDGTSAVARGLAINAALLCAINPPFPEADPNIVVTIEDQ